MTDPQCVSARGSSDIVCASEWRMDTACIRRRIRRQLGSKYAYPEYRSSEVSCIPQKSADTHPLLTHVRIRGRTQSTSPEHVRLRICLQYASESLIRLMPSLSETSDAADTADG